MSNDYKIEKIGYPEINKLVQLYNICFGRVIDANFFKWKYFDNPAGEALCLAAKHNGDIVGACAMMPEDFFVFGEKKKIYKCVDLMVHADHRKKGLASKLIFSSVENLRQSSRLFLYTLPSKNSKQLFLKNKWSKLDDVCTCFKHRAYIKIKFLSNNLDKLYKNAVLRTISSISDLCRDYKFKHPEDRIAIIKDERYLKWRISDPRYTYHILGYYEGDNIRGYIVYNAGVGNDTYIIDLESDSDARIASVLLSAVELAALKNNQRAAIALAAKNSILYKTLKNNLYISNPFQRGPLVSALDFYILIDKAYGDKVFNRANWDIYAIHYDDL